jgi:hypothetical protein
VLAAKSPAVPGEPDGDTACRRHLATLDVDAVRALARVKDEVGEIEPPRGGAEAFERFRTVTQANRVFEGVAGLLPGAARERRVSLGAVGRSC